MPHLSLPVGRGGPIVDLYVAVSLPRAAALSSRGQSAPPAVAVKGLIDTGASCSCIDPAIINRLALSPTGKVTIHTPSTVKDKPHLADQYDVSLVLLHPDSKRSTQIHAVPVIESALAHQGIQALIGRDILASCLFVYDGQEQRFCLSF